jgi:hypothetical protein
MTCAGAAKSPPLAMMLRRNGPLIALCCSVSATRNDSSRLFALEISDLRLAS